MTVLFWLSMMVSLVSVAVLAAVVIPAVTDCLDTAERVRSAVGRLRLSAAASEEEMQGFLESSRALSAALGPEIPRVRSAVAEAEKLRGNIRTLKQYSAHFALLRGLFRKPLVASILPLLLQIKSLRKGG